MGDAMLLLLTYRTFSVERFAARRANVLACEKLRYCVADIAAATAALLTQINGRRLLASLNSV
jgi:hypothetical protein